jgi:alkanesulfonate monooxygenase SsuD/methylene tetrahydromethanopterin reductase-like flavin-dependent oxidoreductase (luciferase family)
MSDREATKRLAQQGQWKTPPLPVFASSVGVAAPPAADAALPLPTALPTTPDEYARMLQEAYKRGAEAAARAQKYDDEDIDGVQSAVESSAATATYVQYPAQNAVSAMHVKAANNYNFPLPPQPVQSNLKPVQQSMSMPDISSYHQKAATDEEEKRKKRLARNRASARLRRLKKKNLVRY